MLKQILGLILLGITISVGISTGFNPHKMAAKMREMAVKSIHDASRVQLPSLKGHRGPNPYGCDSYDCHMAHMAMEKKSQQGRAP